MKFELDLPKEKLGLLREMIAEWKKLSPYPLTHIAGLQKVEREIATQLLFILLQGNNLNKLEELLENE